MSYLDKEIARIEKYIAGLGIKLIKLGKQHKNTETKDFGSWCPNYIEIFVNEHITKTDLILTLLHEASHQIYYAHNKIEIPDEVMLPIASLTKAQRKKILDYERKGIELMPTLAVELNLKLPLWKIYAASELDLFCYEYFYEHGDYPSTKIKKEKKKVLVKKYKGNKYE